MITVNSKVIVTDLLGREWVGTVVNVSDYREPAMRYAVDVGGSDYVFAGDGDIREVE